MQSLFEWPVCDPEWLGVVNVCLVPERILNTIVDMVSESVREALVPAC